MLGDVEQKDGRAEVRWYTAYFCMIEKDGSLEPHQVDWDRRLDDWGWGACGEAERADP